MIGRPRAPVLARRPPPGRGRAASAASPSAASRPRPRGPRSAGAALSGMRMPLASVRITPDTAPTSIQRISSSGVSRFSNSAKKPPMSEPQVLTPDSPIVSPLVTTERSPSKPQSTLGSPPQTIGEQPARAGPARADEAGGARRRRRGRRSGTRSGRRCAGRLPVAPRRACASSGVYSPKSSIQPSWPSASASPQQLAVERAARRRAEVELRRRRSSRASSSGTRRARRPGCAAALPWRAPKRVWVVQIIGLK